MIIDAHTHIFPDDQAEVFLKNTAEMFNVKTYGLATESDLILKMDENQISYSVIHMVAPYPSGVAETNTWLINLTQPRFIKFGTVHPRFKGFKDEIKRLKDNNICGVKFQPDIQRFFPDDKSLTYRIYEELATSEKAYISFVNQSHDMIFGSNAPKKMEHLAIAFFSYHLKGYEDYGYYYSEEFISQVEGLAWGWYEE